MKNVLFLIPYSQSAIYIEAIAEILSKTQNVYLLTFEPRGDIHKKFNAIGIAEVHSLNASNSSPLKKMANLIRIWKFCRKNNIDLVYSHYQEANLLAVFLQGFIKAKVIITRHHSDCAFTDSNLKEKIADKVINSLTRHYIVPSGRVYEQVVDVEKIKNREKIEKINYGYNYSRILTKYNDRYELGDDEDFVILSSARFIPEKRQGLLINIFLKFRETHSKAKLILLGQGPTQQSIRDLVTRHDLDADVTFMGFVSAPYEHYQEAHIFLHLSTSEASNSAVKEVGIMQTPAIVCSGVGDFNDYIVNGVNGFLVSRDDPKEEVLKLLDQLYYKKLDTKKMGVNIKETVLKEFDIELVSKKYFDHIKTL